MTVDAAPSAPAGAVFAVAVALRADKSPCTDARWVSLSQGALTLERASTSLPIDVQVWAFDDKRVSRPHAQLQCAEGRVTLRDLGSKNGTRVDGRAIDTVDLTDGDVFEIGGQFLLLRELSPSFVNGAVCAWEATGLPTLQTQSPQMARVLDIAKRVAPSDANVEIHGETGTGKEVIAQRIHTWSGRSGPCIAVNAGALPPDLVEAELFGAKKGAYSGATTDRVGLVRAADGGTLFLDEIAELPLSAQTALLRVLQERRVVPVGATAAVPVDFRLIVASHKNLDTEVRAGRFRADLRERLRGVLLELPPVRARREDLGFLVAAALPPHVVLSVAAARFIVAHRWSGNVRELHNTLRAAAALLNGEHTLDVLHLELCGSRNEERATPAQQLPAPFATNDDDDATLPVRLRELLAAHAGNISAVARALGKERMQVYRWVERFGFDPKQFR